MYTTADARSWDLLLEEYRQCCKDWRLRDKYVEDKFIQSVFFFTFVAALAAATATALDHLRNLFSGLLPLIAFVLFAVLFLFALVMLISLVKDTYYRDGSARMIERLLHQLEFELGDSQPITDLLAELGENHLIVPYKPWRVGRSFTRKITATAEEVSSLGIGKPLQQCLSGRPTFKWITFYYGVVTVACLAVSIAGLVLWIAAAP